MNYILDLLLVAIVLLCGWRGFRTGIINGLCGIIAVIIAIYGANLIATAYSGEFTAALEPFATGIVDKVISETVNPESNIKTKDEENRDSTQLTLTDEERQSVYTVSKYVLQKLGLTESAAEGIAQTLDRSVDKVSTEMNIELTNLLCGRLSYILVFAIAFILIEIIFSAIGNVLDLAFGLPGLENINHILGAVFGLAKGIMIVIAITCLFRYFGIIMPDDVVNKTYIFRRLIEENMLANILGI